MEELEEDRARSTLTGTSKMVDKLHIMVPDEKTRAYHEERLRKYPNSCTELSLDSARAVIEFSPDEVVHKIAPRPILFIVAEKDVLAPVEFAKELYDRAGQPKKFRVVRGASHHDTYSTAPYSQEVRDEALEWLKHYLPAKTH
jgi:pimeloyl-ACP methyl ester carboxylesterase